MACATPVQDISIVWFYMMSLCNISLRQGTSIWNQHGVISVWCDVISVTHYIWINYVSHQDIEDKMMWYVTSKGNSYHIMLTWYHTDMSHIVPNPIPSHHHITSSHHIIASHHTPLHNMTSSHYHIPPHPTTSSHLIITSSHPIPSLYHHDMISYWYVTSYRIMSYITSHQTSSHHAIPSLHHITSSHRIITSHHPIPSHHYTI